MGRNTVRALLAVTLVAAGAVAWAGTATAAEVRNGCNSSAPVGGQLIQGQGQGGFGISKVIEDADIPGLEKVPCPTG
jgi:hypothetical protein